MGVNVGVADPFVSGAQPGFEPQPDSPMLRALAGGECSGADPNCRKCFIDGASMDCHRVAHLLDIGAAQFETQATVRITYTSGRVETFTGWTALPPGLDITLGGSEAVVAGAVFGYWNGVRGFGFAAETAVGAVVASRLLGGDGGAGDLFRGFSSSFAPQKRSDLSGDKDLHPPNVEIKHEGLTECVKNYLSKFYDRKILDEVIIHRDELPAIVAGKDKTGAYTSNEYEIWFNKNQYSPNTKAGIALIGHELTHILQWRKYGAAFGVLYLGDSVKVGATTAIISPLATGDAAYKLNSYEMAATKKEKEILADLDKNGNPCP
jgi:hypothetical protein